LILAGIDIIAVDTNANIAAQLARTIQLGNTMHKGAVLSGFGCIFCSLIPRRGASWMMLPLGMMSTTFMVLYGLFWQGDPLAKYQIDENAHDAGALPTDALKSSSSYAVFVRRDDTARKFLHNTFGLVSAAVCVYRFPQKFDGMRNYAVDAVAAIRA